VIEKLSRRKCLELTAGICAALGLHPQLLSAQEPVVTKPIPSTGERLPIIGLGSAAGFWGIADENTDAVRGIMSVLVDAGGTVFDTAPGYLASEEAAGRVVNELGVRDRIFWATKLAPFRSGTVDADEAWRQIETSFERLGRKTIDLMQVHNITADMPQQISILKELKKQGRVRYIGAVTTAKRQYEILEQHMRSGTLDFIAVDYSVDNRSAEENLLPAAREKGIAVIGYIPMRGLWDRVEGHDVPTWAADFGARTWAQFFLKFAASHAAITVVTPATTNPAHMLDNMGAAKGRLPDSAERRRMIEHMEALV
jgi:aryl-alcohol dehydrogenase-like predicted oxidoreductase